MENIRIASTIIMALVSLHIGVAEIVTRPTATEVVVGGSTFLNCSTNVQQEIHWFHTPLGSSQKRNPVYGDNQFYSPYKGGFDMEKDEARGAYNLVIPVVRKGNAGVYECQDETGRGKNESAQLIVLDANPACEPHVATHKLIGPNRCGIEPNQVIISCAVDYNGNESPKLEWRRTSDNISVVEGITHSIVGNKQVVYNLTINGNSSVKDGDSFFCSTTRSATSNGGCTSGKIKVKGTAQGQGTSDGDCNCKSCETAVYCICFLLLLPLSISVIVLCLKLRDSSRRKLPDKKHQEQSLSAAEQKETDEESTSTAVIKKPLLSDLSGDSNSVMKSKIKELESDVNNLELRIQRRDKTIKEGNETIKEGNQTIDALKQKDASNRAENDQLRAQIEELKQQLYPTETIDYADKPSIAYTIQLSETSKGKSINGIAILSNELFAVTESSPEIEVYDSKTFQHQRSMKVSKITDPLDIAASKDANCIYIVCRINEETEKSKVMRLDLGGNVLKQWSTGGEKGRLSTYRSNVILCLSDKQLINEYSPGGELIVTVRLSPAVKLNNPLHAIKVTSTCFVVSHSDFVDELHRVCVVDLDGNIRKECTKWEKPSVVSRTTMKVPICLLEDNERSIIVVDRDNNRILLLNSVLKFQRKLIHFEQISKVSPLSPVRLCFDDTQSKLFVVVNRWNPSKKEWKDGSILILNIK